MSDHIRILKLTALAVLIALGLQMKQPGIQKQAMGTVEDVQGYPENLHLLMPADAACGMIITDGMPQTIDACIAGPVLKDI